MTPYFNELNKDLPFTNRSINPLGAQTELSQEQVTFWRGHINSYEHPVIVFGADLKPMLLNESLRLRLSNPDYIPGSEEPVAFVWEKICKTAGLIVAEAARSQSMEIAEAFPLNQSCFAAVGTVLRNSSGAFIAAIINLADLTGSTSRLREIIDTTTMSAAGNTPSSEASQEYADWNVRRKQARQKMSKLSRRESQVVALVANGFPNKSIAHELDISVKTIEKHRANATRKLGVNGTPEMVRITVIANADILPPRTEPTEPDGWE